jgi:adenine-specific DNA-methyltransferase
MIKNSFQNCQKKTNKKIERNLNTQTISQSALTSMDYSNKSRNELISICKEKSIKGYSGKKKSDIIKLLSSNTKNDMLSTQTKLSEINNSNLETKDDLETKENVLSETKHDDLDTKHDTLPEKIHRLNYIGSKFQLLEWITTHIKEKTGWSSFRNKTIVDMFAGTGIVSYHFRKHMAKVISNDAELYSSIITHAFTCSIYTESCKNIISDFQKDIQDNKHLNTIGFITTHYSPHGSNERKFFTIDNAKRIDYIRNKLETIKDTVSDDEYKFILASIILSADAVSNVPAVYGCFLKNFKKKAINPLILTPIHNNSLPAIDGSNTHNSDVLNIEFLSSFESDLVYLDPPYNERQYSKNYFPLNIIAKTPKMLLSELPLKGKTGIPTDCFISPFCRKGDIVEKSFDLLFRELKTKWIFLSYNSESIVSKEKMLDIMKKYGTATVIERDYKRFKSFKYNNDVDIKEYLFCLRKN